MIKVVAKLLAPKDTGFERVSDFIKAEKKAVDRQLKESLRENKNEKDKALDDNPFRGDDS